MNLNNKPALINVVKISHLLALPIIGIIFLIIGNYLLEEKKLMLLMVIITFLPATGYGLFWGKRILEEERKNITRYLYSPLFVSLYLILFSIFILSLINKYSIFQLIIISLGIWSAFFIFYAISLLLILTKRGDEQYSGENR